MLDSFFMGLEEWKREKQELMGECLGSEWGGRKKIKRKGKWWYAESKEVLIKKLPFIVFIWQHVSKCFGNYRTQICCFL